MTPTPQRTNIENLVLVMKRFAFAVFVIVVAYFGYRFLLSERSFSTSFTFTIVALWVLTAYFTLPQLHRFLSKIYIPDYFVGRTRTADGLLGDPVNLAFVSNQTQLIQALEAAGWTRADDLNLTSSLKMIQSTLLRKSYPEAPVSPLFLFGRLQDFAYQHEVNGNPAKRHHVRFWKTPKGWKLPGGFDADWLAAGTYDKSVGLSLFTLQITHKIAENTDEERDYIIETLQQTGKVKKLDIIHDYSSGYHHRNGGGDSIKTDGAMPFVHL